MKDLNETLLRTWRPRRPSAGLKRRIMEIGCPPALPAARWLWRCLAPTAATFFTLMALHHDSAGLEQKMPAPLILGNQESVAYATGGAQTEQNHLAAVTFDWTNPSVFKSIVPFTPSTNSSN